ncbi:hypothetical protein Pmani_018645 [Petrolisthes manimaculis]|uniref:Uncharacterized protein n=1 Tax=Petrolisthes manimaculis TaxID=1843537 RepID=A0AAE1PM20_9EUCA|nr:hypothetical protein Pmani_018645 [Petrolisthes manimaculis]
MTKLPPVSPPLEKKIRKGRSELSEGKVKVRIVVTPVLAEVTPQSTPLGREETGQSWHKEERSMREAGGREQITLSLRPPRPPPVPQGESGQLSPTSPQPTLPPPLPDPPYPFPTTPGVDTQLVMRWHPGSQVVFQKVGGIQGATWESKGSK